MSCVTVRLKAGYKCYGYSWPLATYLEHKSLVKLWTLSLQVHEPDLRVHACDLIATLVVDFAAIVVEG
jgi:hypothetical protein